QVLPRPRGRAVGARRARAVGDDARPAGRGSDAAEPRARLGDQAPAYRKLHDQAQPGMERFAGPDDRSPVPRHPAGPGSLLQARGVGRGRSHGDRRRDLEGDLRPAQGHARVLPRHVPAALRGGDRLGELGLRHLRPQGRPAQEDLHAGAPARHRGACAPAPDRVADRRRSSAQHLARLRDVTMDEGRWRWLFNDSWTASFVELLRRESPHLVPGLGPPPAAQVFEPVHGTTVLSVRYRDGVIMAGDRQATAGYQVASRRVEKIFKSHELSGVGNARAAGPAMEMTKLFQTELEHYEKVEGENLSLEGKANRLSQMIRMNLPAAMQGLVVVPIFAGFDEKAGVGRLFKYDITGGRYEETNYDAQGSGSKDARDSLKKLETRDGPRRRAARHARGAHRRRRRGRRDGRSRPGARHLSVREDHHPVRLRGRSRRRGEACLRGDPERARPDGNRSLIDAAALLRE